MSITIISQPSSVAVDIGNIVSFRVIANGDNLTYQWQYFTTANNEWRNSGMTGSTTDTVSLEATMQRNGQMYRCLITDGNGTSVISRTATLIIRSSGAYQQTNRFYLDSTGSLRNTMSGVMTMDGSDSLVINAANAYIEDDSVLLNTYRYFTDSVVGRRMFEYYPLVVQIIVDFQSIIASEYPEFEMAWWAKDEVLANAFLLTMGEARTAEWEAILHLGHDDGDTLEQRRDAVIARLRGMGKLNTESINRIVNAFTGGTAEAYVENSTLYVWIIPPRTSKAYKFSAIEAEINMRKPAHLGLHVERKYQTWGDVKTKCSTWSTESSMYETWNDTMYDIIQS